MTFLCAGAWPKPPTRLFAAACETAQTFPPCSRPGGVGSAGGLFVRSSTAELPVARWPATAHEPAQTFPPSSHPWELRWLSDAFRWRATAHQAAVSAPIRHSVPGGTNFPTMQPVRSIVSAGGTPICTGTAPRLPARLLAAATREPAQTFPPSSHQRLQVTYPCPAAWLGPPLTSQVTALQSGTNLPTMQPCKGDLPALVDRAGEAQPSLRPTPRCSAGPSTNFPTMLLSSGQWLSGNLNLPPYGGAVPQHVALQVPGMKNKRSHSKKLERALRRISSSDSWRR